MNGAFRGEVWLADIGKPMGRESAYQRPAVILQLDDLNHLTTVIVVPLTTNLKHAPSATTILVHEGEAELPKPSVAMCHQLRALDRSRLIRKLGKLPDERLSEIEATVAFTLGLPQ